MTNIRNGSIHAPRRHRARRRARGAALAALFATVALVTPALAQSTKSQAAQAQPLVFSADLSGQNVVPSVDTNASGWALAILHGDQLQVDGAFGNLGSDIATDVRGGIHIHQGGPSDNGPIVFELDHEGDRVGTFSGTFQLDASQIDALQNGQFYIQIHSVDHKAGVLRGQLSPYTPSGSSNTAGAK